MSGCSGSTHKFQGMPLYHSASRYGDATCSYRWLRNLWCYVFLTVKNKSVTEIHRTVCIVYMLCQGQRFIVGANHLLKGGKHYTMNNKVATLVHIPCPDYCCSHWHRSVPYTWWNPFSTVSKRWYKPSITIQDHFWQSIKCVQHGFHHSHL